MNTSEIRKQLWNSLDMRCVRHDMSMVLIVGPAAAAIYGLLNRTPYFWLVALLVIVLTVPPFLIWFLWELYRVFRIPEGYVLCKAKLTQPHSGLWYRSMYFTVALEYPGGGKLIVNTRPIFQTRGWLNPRLEDYLNKTVTIAYNEETETVVVIG